MAVLADLAVQEVLTVERGVLAFETELSNLYAVSEDEVASVVRAFYQKHAKDGKISFAALRRYLSTYDWSTFSLVLQSWQKEASAETSGLRKSFVTDITKLIQRKQITYGEELNYRVRYALEKRAAKQTEATAALLAVAVLVAYYTRFYDMSRTAARGVKFVPLLDVDVRRLVYAKWEEPRGYKNFQQRLEDNLDLLCAEYDLVIKQAIAAGQTDSATAKVLSNRMKVAFNRDRGLTRTEANRAANAADLAAYRAADVEEYLYCAILDEVTSQICWSLNGHTFRVSQAQEQVNFPPMHTNCRSTTEPVLPDYDDIVDLTKESRTVSLEDFIVKNYEGEYLDELLDFLHDYGK